jgi:predicted metal-dependent phosphoesterase TrpH
VEKYVDLHIHSCYSDGVYRPAELVAMAVQRGLKAIAIADHDSTEGVDEALEAGIRSGLEVVPAVEFSVAFGNLRDVHLLGYFIDHRDAELGRKLAEFRQRRDSRARAIVEKISGRLVFENKNDITYDDVRSIAGDSVSRLHIAKVLVDKGVVANVQDAFKRYLIPCDVPKQYFPMEEALAEIKRLRGISVLAHPPSISDDRKLLRDLIRQWSEMGLDGIEVFNNLCFKDDMIFFEGLAQELGLLMTGGSDFHGFEDDVEMGIGRGGLAVAYYLLHTMKDIARKRSAGGTAVS